jgi:hypothetical protein
MKIQVTITADMIRDMVAKQLADKGMSENLLQYSSYHLSVKPDLDDLHGTQEVATITIEI